MGGRSWAARIGAVRVFVIVVASMAPANAASKGNDTVSAVPAAGSALDAKGAFYVLQLGPGASLTQTVHVENNNDHPVVVNAQGVDGFTSDQTGASYGT